MARRIRLMRGLSKVAYAIALMILGAEVLAQYLIHTEDDFAGKLRDVESSLQFAFVVFAIAGSLLNPQQMKSDLKEPSPRHSGVAVVLITGATASVAAGRSSYLYALLIGLGTIATAAAVWCFATKHASEIGEARFPSASGGS